MVGWARETEIEIRLDGETFKKICRKKIRLINVTQKINIGQRGTDWVAL